MSIKRFSLRFNTENDEERQAWEYLQQIPAGMRNKLAVEALRDAEYRNQSLAELIRTTIRECLASAPTVKADPMQETLSEDEAAFLDDMDSFLSG